MHLPWIWYNVETKKGVMNMKSVIAIAAMIACRAAFAWAHCDIPMLSFCLPHKQETQLMQKMVEQIRDRSDRLSDRFTRMADNAATRAICDRLGVSNEFMRVEEDARAARAQLDKLIADLRKLESALDEVEVVRGREIDAQVIARMKSIMIPRLSLGPDTTIIDALEFLRKASKETPGRGISFVYKGPVEDSNSGEEDDSEDGEGEASVKEEPLSAHYRRMPQVSAADISFYDALTLICNAAGCRWEIADVGFILVTDDSNVSD